MAADQLLSVDQTLARVAHHVPADLRDKFVIVAADLRNESTVRPPIRQRRVCPSRSDCSDRLEPGGTCPGWCCRQRERSTLPRPPPECRVTPWPVRAPEPVASGGTFSPSQPCIDGLTLQRQNPEDAFVHAVQRLAFIEAFERFKAQ